MSPTTRRRLLHAALAGLAAFNAGLLVALLADQWLIHAPGTSLLLALALAAALYVPSRRVATAVLAMAERHAGIPVTGGTIPPSGQPIVPTAVQAALSHSKEPACP